MIFIRYQSYLTRLYFGGLVLLILISCPRILSQALSNYGMIEIVDVVAFKPINLQSENYMLVNQLLKKATQLDSRNQTAWQGLGLIALSNGSDAEVIDYWDNIPNVMTVRTIGWAEQERASGNFEQAAYFFDLAEKLNSNSLALYFFKSKLFRANLQQPEESLVVLLTGLNKKDTMTLVGKSDLYHELGLIYREEPSLKCLECAEESFLKSIEIDSHIQIPKFRVYFHLANLLKEMGKGEEAIYAYESVIKLKDNQLRAHLELGMLYWSERGDFVNAEKHFLYAMDLRPTHLIAPLQLGQLYFENGDIEKAIDIYKKTLEIDPENQKALSFLEQYE